MRNTIMQSALHYVHEFGFSVIPISKTGNKKPLIPWEEYQRRKPTDAELNDWFSGIYKSVPNIGIVTGEVSRNCVIDIDEFTPDVPKYIPHYLWTPTVVTPRDGRHLHLIHPGFRVGNNQKKLKGVDFRGDGGYVVAPPSTNDDGKGYRWIISPETASLCPIPDAYMSLLCEDASSIVTVPSMNDAFSKGHRDEDLFHVAYCMARGGMEEKEIVFVLSMLAKQCEPPFPISEVVLKVKSAVKRARRVDVGKEVEEWIISQQGLFDVSDIYRDLQISDRDDKKLLTAKLRSMLEEQTIQHTGKTGRYRIVENECEVIKWWDSTDEPLDLGLPLGLSDLTYVLPKSIIVIAGFSNSGKTAFALDFIRMNMDKYPHQIHYFNSEMGQAELRERLRRFKNTKRNDWKQFTAYERSDNFSDVIHPEGFNVIDYLEVNDEFWKVGAQIKEIHDKLTTGMAMILLQKKEGARMGVGAEFGIHKSRLYLSMEHGHAEIVKCKNFANPHVDPNGMSAHFSLTGGYQFEMKTSWRREKK